MHLSGFAPQLLCGYTAWAIKVTIYNEFENYKIILTNLKNYKSKFAQKSVGNNLNDLYKEYPEKANEIIKEWNKDNPTNKSWIKKYEKG
jgi:3-methyladenine DNA glycosylase AlkC